MKSKKLKGPNNDLTRELRLWWTLSFRFFPFYVIMLHIFIFSKNFTFTFIFLLWWNFVTFLRAVYFSFAGVFIAIFFFAMFRHPRAVQRWFIERQFAEMTSHDCRINVGLSGGSELMKLLSGDTRWPGACKSSQWFQLSHPPTRFVSATKDEKTKLRDFRWLIFCS